jgi:hypothetical protein
MAAWYQIVYDEESVPPMDTILQRLATAPSLPFIWRQMTRYFTRQGFGANSYYLVLTGSNLP